VLTVKGIRGIVGFVRTVEAGSFAGAAKKLGISPVAVGKNVQRLERQLGVRLLQRSTRKLSLTEEGRSTTSVAPDRFAIWRALSRQSPKRAGLLPARCG
jgi:DNA-binding transcriptional LysR family regulator